MVIRLAEALDVPLRERNALLLNAGFAPVYEETPLSDPELDAVRTALERILDGHLPYPAVITDRHGDLVVANAAFAPLTRGVAPDPLAPPSTSHGSSCTHAGWRDRSPTSTIGGGTSSTPCGARPSAIRPSDERRSSPSSRS